jgi:hypothetical protein
MRHGPIETEMEMIPGDPNDLKGDTNGVYDGVNGYPKGSGGKIPELTFDEAGNFGKVDKPASKG